VGSAVLEAGSGVEHHHALARRDPSAATQLAERPAYDLLVPLGELTGQCRGTIAERLFRGRARIVNLGMTLVAIV